jgi:hypothetical protein
MKCINSAASSDFVAEVVWSVQWLGNGLGGRDSFSGRSREFFSLCHHVHPANCPVGTGALSRGLKLPVREAEHSLPSGAEVKNPWMYTSTVLTCLHDVVLS